MSNTHEADDHLTVINHKITNHKWVTTCKLFYNMQLSYNMQKLYYKAYG